MSDDVWIIRTPEDRWARRLPDHHQSSCPVRQEQDAYQDATAWMRMDG